MGNNAAVESHLSRILTGLSQESPKLSGDATSNLIRAERTSEVLQACEFIRTWLTTGDVNSALNYGF